MNQTERLSIGVIEPVNLAMTRTRDILFRPFDPGKWLVIGFCAFLAMLGEGGAGGGSYGGGGRRGGPAGVSESWSAIVPYLPIIIFVVIAGVAVGIFLAVLFAWLRGRGQFMFLDCIARNVAHVVKPWHEYRHEGNSIFRFYLLLILATFGLILLAFGIVAIGAILVFAAGRVGAVFAILIGSGVLVLFIPLFVLLALVGALTRYFVVPMMYVGRIEWRAAWLGLWNLIRKYPGPFALWILMLVLINMAIGLAIGALIFVSFCLCCIGCCLVPIACLPYISTVILLPVHVFKRSYALYFLAQFGPGYDVFAVQPVGSDEDTQIIA